MPDSVKNKASSSGDTIAEKLANAYFNLEPYNVMANESYFDNFLQENIDRPKNIIWLNETDRITYRKEKFHLDEHNNYISKS